MAISNSEKLLIGAIISVFVFGVIILASVIFFFSNIFDVAGDEELPILEWESNYLYGDFSEGLIALETNDGNILMGAVALPHYSDSEYIYLAKSNPAGETIWENEYPVYDSHKIFSIEQTEEGDFILIGITSIKGEWLLDDRSELFILTVLPCGEKEGINYIKPFSITGEITALTTIDDDIVVALRGVESALVRRVDRDGKLKWDRYTALREICEIRRFCDESFIFIGLGLGMEGDNFGWANIDLQGDKKWERVFQQTDKRFGGLKSPRKIERTLIEIEESGFITATSNIIYGGNGIYLKKMDYEGNKQWDLRLSGNYLIDITATDSGGCLVSCGLPPYNYIGEVDSEGALLWTMPSKRIRTVNNIEQTSDGGYIVTGRDWGDKVEAYIAKLAWD